MRQFLKYLFFTYILNALISLKLTSSYSQCTGGTSAGAITPAANWQTQCIQGGQYFTFTGLAGLAYTFSFCNGGGSTSFTTEMTILLNTSGSGMQIPGAYSVLTCGAGTEYVFRPTSNGSYRILVTEYDWFNGYGCISNTNCATLAFKVAPPDEPCAAVFINPSCTSAYNTYFTDGATPSSGIPNPGCANYAGGDVWFKTVVPYGNSFRVRTVANAITNSGMAVYRAASCAGPFTLISCNDDIGGGNNMSQINLTNNASLSPGDSVYIRFWANNNAQIGTFGIYVFDFTQTYCMNGSPTQLFSNGCLKMTSNSNFQSGTVWNNTKLNLSAPFNYYFTANFGTDDAGADGITFAMQNNASGMSTIGSAGQALALQNVSNSVIVEFDTYDNGAGVSDISNDHTAISLNGNIAAPVVGPLNASATSANIEDGLDHTINIDWDPSTITLRVYFDGNLRMTYVNDLVTNVFGGSNMVYWGFSSSTGAQRNNQTVCPGNLPGVPLPVVFVDFSLEQLDKSVLLEWTTSFEKNVYEFVIERSMNGFEFYPIGTVEVQVSGNNFHKYNFIDRNPLGGVSYYRIKEIDNDGQLTYSSIRYYNPSNELDLNIKVYPNPVQQDGDITVNCFVSILEEDSFLIIYDICGREVMKENLKAGQNPIHLAPSLIAGMYQLSVHSGGNRVSQHLAVIK